jgi:hypothetical protein
MRHYDNSLFSCLRLYNNGFIAVHALYDITDNNSVSSHPAILMVLPCSLLQLAEINSVFCFTIHNTLPLNTRLYVNTIYCKTEKRIYAC